MGSWESSQQKKNIKNNRTNIPYSTVHSITSFTSWHTHTFTTQHSLCTVERLDQGHLHPLLEHPDTKHVSSRNRIRVACVVGVNFSKELFEQLFWCYSELVYSKTRTSTWFPLCICSASCRPKGTCEFLPLNNQALAIPRVRKRWGHHCGETWLRSSPSSTRAPQDKHVSIGNQTRASCVIGDHSSKELFEQLMLLLFGTSI
jgi:hypothetical protein